MECPGPWWLRGIATQNDQFRVRRLDIVDHHLLEVTHCTGIVRGRTGGCGFLLQLVPTRWNLNDQTIEFDDRNLPIPKLAEGGSDRERLHLNQRRHVWP